MPVAQKSCQPVVLPLEPWQHRVQIVVQRVSKETEHAGEVIRREYLAHLPYERAGDNMAVPIEGRYEVGLPGALDGFEIV